MLLVRRLIYLILVVLTALAVEVRYVSGQGYWVLWAGLSLAIIVGGGGFAKRLSITLVSGVLLSVTSILANTLTLYPPLLVVYLISLIYFAMLFIQRDPNHHYSVFTVLFFTILSAALPTTLVGGIDRGCDIFVGAIIACVYQCIFLPAFYRSEINAKIYQMIESLVKLTDEIFACFLQPAYAENTYSYERRIHVQKKRFIGLLQYAIQMDTKKNHYHAMLVSLEKIFELLLSCALLRVRVTDQTIFAVCHQELTDIYEELRLNLNEMLNVFKRKNSYLNTQGLLDRIERLENNYQTVLQVTAYEPLVFLLFISSLKDIKEEIEKFKHV